MTTHEHDNIDNVNDSTNVIKEKKQSFTNQWELPKTSASNNDKDNNNNNDDNYTSYKKK